MNRLINLMALLLISATALCQSDPKALEIIKKTDELIRGNSNTGEIEMTITRSKWSRTLKMKTWAKGQDYSMIYITYPAQEKGQVFLKRGKEMWNYVPSIERMVKIPPSMMMQSWMGSDLTNDDLVNAASIVVDYTHTILGEETIEGYECYIIQLIPKEDAPVVWGKIKSWVSKEGNMTLKNEYYDEDDYLVNTEQMSEIKTIGKRTLPTKYLMTPADKPGQKTEMVFKSLQFDVPMDDDFFSIQNMKRIK